MVEEDNTITTFVVAVADVAKEVEDEAGEDEEAEWTHGSSNALMVAISKSTHSTTSTPLSGVKYRLTFVKTYPIGKKL